MKKVNVDFKGVYDSTSYLFSFAKCLCAAVYNSPYKDLSEDIIAASGFAFRMWADEKELCPSATSTWDFEMQKPWVENGGILCDYVGRYWEQNHIEKEKRLQAIDIIKKSIDSKAAAICWDISGCEWGVITGYDDEENKFLTLNVAGEEKELSYNLLGKGEIPILSVLTIIGMKKRKPEILINDTISLAVEHLEGKERCETVSGLRVYNVLCDFIDKISIETSWNLEYYLGTYGALKYYAYKFFYKYNYTELDNLYENIYNCWLKAFKIKNGEDILLKSVKESIKDNLYKAFELENKALTLMKNMI